MLVVLKSEGVQRISLRDRIFREVVANLLVHREFSNAFPAKFIIGEGRVVTENRNRPHGHGPINPAVFTSFTRNAVITTSYQLTPYFRFAARCGR